MFTGAQLRPSARPGKDAGLGEVHQGCFYNELDSGTLLQTPSPAFALRVSYGNSNLFQKDWSFASFSFWRKKTNSSGMNLESFSSLQRITSL